MKRFLTTGTNVAQQYKMIFMANDRMSGDQPPQGTGGPDHLAGNRKEGFNEISEISLEERMNAADRIGIPAERVSDAAATGAVSGGGNRMNEESTGEETDR